MTAKEKQFAEDLLRALDIGLGDEPKENEDYFDLVTGHTRKEILKTIRELIRLGYGKITEVK